jgi:hypothetical protein
MNIMSRRQFILLSGLGAFGAGGYGLHRAVEKVRGSARRMSEE